MEEDSGWTYGAQPDIQSWCDLELRPSESQGDPPLPHHYDTLHSYLTAETPNPAPEVAAAYLSLAHDKRPLSSIFARGSTTAEPIQQAIFELPAAHPRLVDLLRAIRDISADRISMTTDQRAELADKKLNESLRLTLLRFYIYDGLGHSTGSEEELNFTAFEACFCARDQNTDDLQTGLRTIRDALERAPGDDEESSPDTRVLHAAYWLIRAGRLIYANFDPEDGKSSWVSPNCLGEPSELWKPANASNKDRLRPERWQFWKQRLEWFSEQDGLEEMTTDMAKAAAEKMDEIGRDCRAGVHAM